MTSSVSCLWIVVLKRPKDWEPVFDLCQYFNLDAGYLWCLGEDTNQIGSGCASAQLEHIHRFPAWKESAIMC